LCTTMESTERAAAIGHVSEVIVENFKSYAGRVRIGPFRRFTCVVGPNGAGKSNLMDAISFVLGVRTRHLRSERLIELVHRKEGESSEAVARRPASVELVYVLGDGAGKDAAAEVVFRRQVNPPGAATFQVDGQSVSQAEYMTHLEGINILSKARNCLIFQGDVEAAAHRGGKDLTVFFEQVSGSVAFREEYEQIAAEKKSERGCCTLPVHKKAQCYQ